MASLSKSYSDQKLQGKVYTPFFIVEKMLDDAGFVGNSLLGKTVLDPACGDGRFLTVAAQRIIALSPPDTLAAHLSCLHGWDIDPEAVSLCRQNLSLLIRPLGIEINWQIEVKNALLQIPRLSPENGTNNDCLYDFIFANPPYIRIQHLEVEQRQFLQQHYTFCKNGSTDIYIAFFELCYHLLTAHGVAALITPNTYFYSQTARVLRRFLAERGSLHQITNYHALQLFENATTYSAISIFGQAPLSHFQYEEARSSTEFERRRLPVAEVAGSNVWQLGIQEEALPQINNGRRLGEVCQISVGITTLCDKAYILEMEHTSPENTSTIAPEVWVKTALLGRICIERGILKPIIKASTLKSGSEPIRQYVLFPYLLQGKKYGIMAEDYLSEHFPLAYRYLLSVREWLDKRDAGKPNAVAWYAFGRSQGLNSSFGRKILFSPMNKKPNFILSAYEDCTFYSGYCIKYEGDENWLLGQLNSERMQQFIAMSSRDFRNGWKAYNKTVLQDFVLDMSR